MGQENYSNITVQFTIQIVWNQHLTFVRNWRSFYWEGGVTTPYALSDSPLSLPTEGTATSPYVIDVRWYTVCGFVRWRDQMMAVSADWKLTRCSRVFLQKPSGPQLQKKFPESYDFLKFVTTFKSARYLSLSCAQLIQLMHLSHFLNIGFNIILPSTPISSNWTLTLRSPHPKPVCTCPVTYTSNLPTPSHSCWFDHAVIFFFSFYSFAAHLDMITSLFIELNAKLDCSRSVKNFINIYIKMSLLLPV